MSHTTKPKPRSIPKLSLLLPPLLLLPIFLLPLLFCSHQTEFRDSLYRGVEMDPSHFNRERYDHTSENPFRRALENPLSTFSVDVDTASYTNIRRFLQHGQMPPPDAVRIEEMINYFDYGYQQPKAGDHPFAVHTEIAQAPWNTKHRLARIGLKGVEFHETERAPRNLVFLIDVSGSMSASNKLGLLKQSLSEMVRKLDHRDKVAIAVYAGAAGLVLPSTSCDNKQKILSSLDALSSGGSTNGGAGIKLAYKVAQENFIKGGVNRVILASDGDFNVGVSSNGGLVRLVEQKAKHGVYLTVLGLGTGNLNDSMMEQISNKGNGNYYYIDTITEARKVLLKDMNATLQTIAKDVKIQVEFNPTLVGAYRLIGYENRMLKKEDFDDDQKDAGEIGAGHTVTALYEVVPAGQEEWVRTQGQLKYQSPAQAEDIQAGTSELFTVRLRYKRPGSKTSQRFDVPVVDRGGDFPQASADFKLASAAASFGMLLRQSEHRGSADYSSTLQLAQEGLGEDPHGYRRELVALIETAQQLKK